MTINIYKFAADFDGTSLAGVFSEESNLVWEVIDSGIELYFGEFTGHREGISFSLKPSHFEMIECNKEDIRHHLYKEPISSGINPVKIYTEGLADGVYFKSNRAYRSSYSLV